MQPQIIEECEDTTALFYNGNFLTFLFFDSKAVEGIQPPRQALH